MENLEIAKQVAYDAGTLIKSKYHRNAGIISSSGKDVKTEADMASHEFICNQLKKTGIPILSEESQDKKFDSNI